MRGGGERTIHLMDDVLNWEQGDELVLASTDFDLNQAEVVTVKACEQNSCIVDGLVKYDHFGEIDSGVDMRGEVGLLSRNVLIHGEMEGSCYGEQLCNHFQFDTFGGHVVAREGFASFKVENAELTSLGQQGIVARYPLHWHMAGNVSADTSYVRNNSIHHTLQRCVTCHGSFGCVIEDNIAFESLGHCYFMEDGVENGTIMTGNLGLNTRKGFVIPSDADPATFWITHPDSHITGNTAGGSEGKGFWFLQASLPTGLSGKLQQSGAKHFYDKDELYRTKIGSISGNTVHSSPLGFFFDSILLPDQGAGKRNSGKFSPKEDPNDPESSDLTTNIADITCYKAKETCIWMHLPRGYYSNMRIADSGEGMFVHEISNVNNSLFVGESERNFGFPNRIEKGRPWYRSMPRSRRNIGFRNYVNPSLIENSVFVSFKDSSTQVSRAIAVRAIGFKSILTGASNITFVSTPLAGRFLEDKKPAREFLYKDYSGSISTFPDSYLVQNFSHLTSAKCFDVPEWGSVAVCPHKYVSFPLGGMGKDMSLIRTDEPDHI